MKVFQFSNVVQSQKTEEDTSLSSCVIFTDTYLDVLRVETQSWKYPRELMILLW